MHKQRMPSGSGRRRTVYSLQRRGREVGNREKCLTEKKGSPSAEQDGSHRGGKQKGQRIEIFTTEDEFTAYKHCKR